MVRLFSQLESDGLLARCVPLPPRPATDAELRLCHSAEHIQNVDTAFERAFATAGEEDKGENAQGPFVRVTQDIYYNAGTALAARTAAGCCTEAALQASGHAVAYCLHSRLPA